jgi:uncharacterized protein YndB with AHSA1/START domain
MQAVLPTPLEALVACVLTSVLTAPATGADVELPPIVVSARVPSQAPDIVSNDRVQRSPDVHWPTALSLQSSEMFAHNEIEINASCATVWNRIVEAGLWPRWFPSSGKVKVKGDSQMLQKNTKFSWSGFDLPLENRFESFPRPTESKVIEYVPVSRIGWVSYATSTVYGPICDSYHNWFLTPNGAKRCHVIFEEVATGLAAQHARGNYVEILHLSHQRWLEALKRISESKM